MIIFFILNQKILYDSLGFPFLPQSNILFYENFSDPFVFKRWQITNHFRTNGKWSNEYTYPLQTRKGEKGLVIKTKEKSHGISYLFPTPIYTPNETLIIQYETRAQFLYLCASVFLKIFIDPKFNPIDFNNQTSRFLEFGPERCNSYNNSRLNFFINNIEYKLKKKINIPIDEISHLYTLIIRSNNTFEILIDMKSIHNGTFTNSFNPNIIEPEFIDDINDKKPLNWVEEEYIYDLNAKKPIDWDENQPKTIPDPKKLNPPYGWLINEEPLIPDLKAKKPENWNENNLGKWNPPMIPNPKCLDVPGCGKYKIPEIFNIKYKGKWSPPLIKNPNYKGEWIPKQIKNPNFNGKIENFILPPIYGIGFDIWGLHHDLMITNILISNNESIVKKWNKLDFSGRQKRQIKAMKISYDWINVDEEDEIDNDLNIFYKLLFKFKKMKKIWDKVQNKSAIIAIVLSSIMILIPILLICCEMFSTNDSFKTKLE